jgi:hypothetical protein
VEWRGAKLGGRGKRKIGESFVLAHSWEFDRGAIDQLVDGRRSSRYCKIPDLQGPGQKRTRTQLWFLRWCFWAEMSCRS